MSDKSSTFAVDMAKRIIFSVPVDVMSGSLSGRQDLTYGTGEVDAYNIPTGSSESAANYQPRIVAMWGRKRDIRYFQVRTRHSVNMTTTMRNNMAVMGGAGSLYWAIVKQNGDTYNECVDQWRRHAAKGETFRSFLMKAIRVMLENGQDYGDVGDSEVLDNPWKLGNEQGDVNVPVPQSAYAKFNDILSNL